MDFVEKSGPTFLPINIGTGQGSSVFEVIERISEVSSLRVNPAHSERREGDPAALVADVARASASLGWKSSRGLTDIVESAWNAWNYPK
jgi:UDP-glucose 4-epimerase